MKNRKWLEWFILGAILLVANGANAVCRLDWNGDGVIDMADYNGQDGPCQISGFYPEWYILMYMEDANPGFYAYCFPGGDPDAVDYNGNGVIDQDDYLGQMSVDEQTEGFYLEWYLYHYRETYPGYYETFIPETHCLDYEEEFDRGDLSTFPIPEVLFTCEDACYRIDGCGAYDNPAYPLELTECLGICGSMNAHGSTSPVTKEFASRGRSYEFRSCASQEAGLETCEKIDNCAGWLYRPKWTTHLCDRYCECTATTVIILDESYLYESAVDYGQIPPKGYKFSKHRLVVEPTHESTDYRAKYGARVKKQGRRTVLEFDEAIDSDDILEIARTDQVLPTFEDRAGRLAAAAGGVYITVANQNKYRETKDKLSRKGKRHPVKTKIKDNLYFIPTTDGWEALEVVAVLSSLEGVESELNMAREYEYYGQVPNDPLFADQWHLLNDGNELSVAGIDGRVSEAWDITMGSSEVVIAVLDSGVDLGHPDLQGKLLPEDNYPTDWQSQMSAGFAVHGTSVAGVAAAYANNNEGGAGVCPECSVLPAALGEVTPGGFQLTDQIIAETFTRMVDRGADVINNSWGPVGPDPRAAMPNEQELPPQAEVVSAALDYAEEVGRNGLGTVVVFAAGNFNNDVTLAPFVKHPTVIGVAAVDDQGLKAPYSSHGSTIDIAAPSSGGLVGITTTNVPGGYGPDIYTPDFGGTSSAAPFISGVVGLMISAHPGITAAEVRGILEQSARIIDPVWGEWANGRSNFYGAGLVNAHAALMLASGACSDPATCETPSDVCQGDCNAVSCDICRTDADCAADYACQAVPELGISTCVAVSLTGSCPVDFELAGGFCVPTRLACGTCQAEEPNSCNFRDDDCDGDWFDPIAECENQRCLQNGLGCASGDSCANTICTAPCATDEDCGGGYCYPSKDRYGHPQESQKICVSDLAAAWESAREDCFSFCPVVVSTLNDTQYDEFESCLYENPDVCDLHDTTDVDHCVSILADSFGDHPLETCPGECTANPECPGGTTWFIGPFENCDLDHRCCIDDALIN